MKKTLVLIILSASLVLGLTGCDKRSLATGAGAAVGGTVGGLAGGTTGAVIGGVAGAVVGNQLAK